MIAIMQNLVLIVQLHSFPEWQLLNSSSQTHHPFRKEWCKVTESRNKTKVLFNCDLFHLKNTKKRELFFEFVMTLVLAQVQLIC